jgi:nucleoside-diphosphate-sugar epimerase
MSNTPVKTILISGATGFIGRALHGYFSAQGHRVIGLVRTKTEAFESRVFDLREKNIPVDLFENVDVFIHAAYVKQTGKEDTYSINVDGSLRLFEAAAGSGVKQLVFISSLAAHEGALSVYGRQKFAIEQRAQQAGYTVIRPGLVLGHGGLFASLAAHLEKSNKIPLVGGGNQPLQTVHISDLVQAVAAAVDRNSKGVFTIAETPAIAYRQFYELLCAAKKAKPFFIPVPYWIMKAGIAVAGLIGMKLPVNKDNVLGLQAMRFDDPQQSINELGIRIRSAAESIRDLLN